MRPRRKPQPHSGSPEAPAGAPPPPPASAGPVQDRKPARHSAGQRIRTEMLWLDAFLRRWLLRLMVLGTHAIIIVVACYFIVWSVARGRTYDSVEKIPARLCAVVLGTVPKVEGRDNLYFTTRIKAAASLYHAGKAQYLIVSGDNSRHGYDEPTAMKAALIAKGVPANNIYCDYAGFRTLDSIVRAQRVFGQTRFTIISQPFHNVRALYIARRKGLVDCVALNAADIGGSSSFTMHLRELAARFWAILDVEFLKTEPKFLGNRVEIGEKHPPVDAAPPRK